LVAGGSPTGLMEATAKDSGAADVWPNVAQDTRSMESMAQAALIISMHYRFEPALRMV
jgi:hypothetical protein